MRDEINDGADENSVRPDLPSKMAMAISFFNLAAENERVGKI